MRISIDGEHILGAVQGVYLDNTLIMANGGLSSGGWDFLSNTIIGYGGWGAHPGLYGAELVPPHGYRWLDDGHQADAIGLWSDGQRGWVGQFSDGARDWVGNYWPDRQALGASRQGDWIFVDKATFTDLIVRQSDGRETVLPLGKYFTFGGMDGGIVMYQPVGSTAELFEVW